MCFCSSHLRLFVCSCGFARFPSTSRVESRLTRNVGSFVYFTCDRLQRRFQIETCFLDFVRREFSFVWRKCNDIEARLGWFSFREECFESNLVFIELRNPIGLMRNVTATKHAMPRNRQQTCYYWKEIARITSKCEWSPSGEVSLPQTSNHTQNHC